MLNIHTVYTAYDYKKILLALLLSTSFAEKSIWDYSGYINYTYLESSSNGRLINILTEWPPSKLRIVKTIST